MATFLLIHGGGHRGWHWNLVESELAALGHRTVAPDVPMENPRVGAATWADVALEALGDVDPAEVVVVGHSYGGLVLPVIGARGRFRRLVFVCANVPIPGMSYADYMALPENEGAVILPEVHFDEEGSMTLSYQVAREVYYGDVEESLARAAWERLLPTGTGGFNETCPIDEWPDIPSSYILCTDDRIIGHDWSRRVAQTRLGGPAIELPGSHSPMLSRPRDLAIILDQLAAL